jgi:hypothetical protein
MKIESFHHALPYFFTQQIPRKVQIHLLELEPGKVVPANLLRWEDDGGRSIAIHHSTLDQKRKKPNA